MKANAPKRKVFNDAVDLLMEDMPVVSGKGISEISVDKIKPFHNHPFHLYEGDRLDDMVESIKEHGILNPVIVMKMDARGLRCFQDITDGMLQSLPVLRRFRQS